MNLAQQTEAILFWRAEPISFKKLAAALSTEAAPVTEEQARAAVAELAAALQGRGLAVVQTEDEAMLGTAKELAPLIERLTKEELARDLGKAGLETLSIVLYQGPISRADIDYIRGVNSQFIVRNLLVRGLIERVDNPADARSFLYKPTLDLLAHLGVSKISDLPDYEKVRADIAAFKAAPEPAEAVQPSTEPALTPTVPPDATMNA